MHHTHAMRKSLRRICAAVAAAAALALPALTGVRVTGAAVPAGVTPDFSAGRAAGTVAAPPPLRGSVLTGRTVADGLCVRYASGTRPLPENRPTGSGKLEC
ncbi:hypothetical protein GCM10010145_43650 [Streptomyces ruber]|uniref:Serine/threonine protein kinase n=2 Tax=Streptomyces TaxID=1883 RepID=A0A918BHG1_9ACTN|nr:hypothetical protein [Streptomyces ruber]GGQ69170.1 hypothetical protein GCM10010145_43650 [Streptomyces ruber]